MAIFLVDQPENVCLTTNTTSKVCTGVVINFICIAEANPAVHTYLLYENDTMVKNMVFYVRISMFCVVRECGQQTGHDVIQKTRAVFLWRKGIRN